VVTESRLTPQQELSSAAWGQAQADGIVAQLREQAAKLRERQSSALSGKSEATAKDGSVKAVVDASGVVTSLEFSPSVFERTTPDKLARTVVATIQSAATKARAQMNESLESMRGEGSGLLAQAAAGAERLGLPAVGVPEVPHTEEDPTGRPEAWTAGPAADEAADKWSPPAEEPEIVPAGNPMPTGTPMPAAASKVPSRRPAAASVDEDDDGLDDERPW
jgi:DNA-binding protein YbaB